MITFVTAIQATLAVIALGIVGWLVYEMVREKRQLEEDLMREFGLRPSDVHGIRVMAKDIATLPLTVRRREGWCGDCGMPILPDDTCLCSELSLERYRRTKNHG